MNNREAASLLEESTIPEEERVKVIEELFEQEVRDAVDEVKKIIPTIEEVVLNSSIRKMLTEKLKQIAPDLAESFTVTTTATAEKILSVGLRKKPDPSRIFFHQPTTVDFGRGVSWVAPEPAIRDIGVAGIRAGTIDASTIRAGAIDNRAIEEARPVSVHYTVDQRPTVRMDSGGIRFIDNDSGRAVFSVDSAIDMNNTDIVRINGRPEQFGNGEGLMFRREDQQDANE